MILSANAVGSGAAACEVAAVLSERDFLRFGRGEGTADLRLRIEMMNALKHDGRHPQLPHDIDRPSCRRVLRVAKALKQRVGIADDAKVSAAIGRLLAWAYPERIARRRPKAYGRYLMVNGRGAFFQRPDPLATEDYLVVAELDGERREARIFLASAYDEADLFDQNSDRIRQEISIAWSSQQLAVLAERTLRLGALTLRSEPLEEPDPEKVRAALIEGIRQQGCKCLPWNPMLRQWQSRVCLMRRLFPQDSEWPDASDPTLIATLEDWLGPYLYGMSRLKDLERSKLKEALTALLTYPQRKRLNALAPTHLKVPSGSRIPIDYTNEPPVLAVRLQEVFGTTQTPAIAGGRYPLLLHLLSPAGRPVQVTRDLAGFWQTGYTQVKKELKGRYPKHFWPDDPLKALPTARCKPRKKKKHP
jgi:ATP-dependent helicase HrpB